MYTHVASSYNLIDVLLCIQTELNYMDPSNLEFTEEPSKLARRREADQTVQYGRLANSPQYANM